MVEMTGVEPVSKKRFIKVSPGAAYHQDSPTRPPISRQPGSVASFIHDGPQSLSPFTCTANLMPKHHPAVKWEGQQPKLGCDC